jgi:hypothetical protein
LSVAWGLSALFATAQDTAQQILQTSAAGLTGRRCVGSVVLITATRRCLLIVGRNAALRWWLGIAALAAAKLTEQVPEYVRALS